MSTKRRAPQAEEEVIFETANPVGVPCRDNACPLKFPHRHIEGQFAPAPPDDEHDDTLGRALREAEREGES